MTLVSQAIFARMCKTTPKTVTKWKQEGRLVLQGLQVDVEATDALMKRYRRKGSPIVLSAAEATTQRRKKGNESGVQGNNLLPSHLKGNSQVTELRCEDIIKRLEDLDWTQQFEWTHEAKLRRAQNAAKCIGWEAVQSDLRDDGHWGGLQLRITEQVAKHGLTEDAVVAGFGYELFPFQVLQEVRKELEPALGPDDTATVDLMLLPLLARPFHESDRPDL